MSLRLGNPHLKMGKNYAFTCDYTLQDIIRLHFQYKFVTNPILFSRRYFSTNTTLSEFGGYEALAGAVLTTPINAKSYDNISLSVTGATKRGAILAKGSLNYTFENPETDLLGNIFRSYAHRLNADLALFSNFSQTFRLDVTNRISYNYVKINAEELQKNSWIRNNLMAKASLNLFYRMMINANYMYNYNYNS